MFFFGQTLCVCLLAAVSAGVEALAETADVCTLSNAEGCVDVALTGARILSWCDTAGNEKLFMPSQPTSDGTEWSHGGIPLCWPWFGRKDGVIHGFIRNKRFSIVSRTKDALLLHYSLAAKEELSFPHDADIDVVIRLKDGLAVALRTRNRSDEPFGFTCGIHPYFAVRDYARLSFVGLEKDPFGCVHGMDKAFPRPFDARFQIRDDAQKQTLSLYPAGASHVILWAPGTVEPCNRNLRPEDMTKFVGCGPAHTKVAGPITLHPGESHEISLQMSMESR